MSHDLWMGMDLDSPRAESETHPRPPLSAGANPKKKRRTNAKAAARSHQATECPSIVQLQSLRPPPLSCFGDTVSVANPFDDTMPRSSRSMTQVCNLSQRHPNAQQYTSGPPVRAMNPMTSMGGTRAMMPHSMGVINQMENHVNAMGGISPMSNSPVGRMSPMNTMGSNQSPGAMNQMGNHMNPMGGMLPMSNSPVGCRSPMGSNQPPGAMHQMGNHMNQMGRMSPMGNSPVGRMSPVNHMGLNQPPGAINPMGSHMNPMGEMAPMSNSPMGRVSPMNNMGAHMNQSHMGHMASNQMSGRAMGNNSMGRASVSPINGMSCNNQNHMANGGTINGPPSINNFNGPFGQNGSQSHHMGMNMHMNSSNLGRQINPPRVTMSSMAPSNINVAGRNSSNMSNMARYNQMGGPMGSVPCNVSGGPPMGHPMNMGGNTGPHGFQARPGMRLMTPSTGKIYPPDQSMVFNSQNRNAPPIYLCGTCHKEVNDNDQGIVCESGCNFWFHRMCVGLTEAAFQLLTKEVYAEWVCDKCLKIKKVPPVKFRT